MPGGIYRQEEHRRAEGRLVPHQACLSVLPYSGHQQSCMRRYVHVLVCPSFKVGVVTSAGSTWTVRVHTYSPSRRARLNWRTASCMSFVYRWYRPLQNLSPAWAEDRGSPAFASSRNPSTFARSILKRYWPRGGERTRGGESMSLLLVGVDATINGEYSVLPLFAGFLFVPMAKKTAQIKEAIFGDCVL